MAVNTFEKAMYYAQRKTDYFAHPEAYRAGSPGLLGDICLKFLAVSFAAVFSVSVNAVSTELFVSCRISHTASAKLSASTILVLEAISGFLLAQIIELHHILRIEEHLCIIEVVRS